MGLEIVMSSSLCSELYKILLPIPALKGHGLQFEQPWYNLDVHRVLGFTIKTFPNLQSTYINWDVLYFIYFYLYSILAKKIFLVVNNKIQYYCTIFFKYVEYSCWLWNLAVIYSIMTVRNYVPNYNLNYK